ncbi:RNA polymerase sigma factor [Tumebacillus lipolyticus]|uniref:RNA polymerase sigma factor n=1 Tax=Tumebacillus lipolyticus TaxID=1280370 RepID=A0ABW4ZTH9_9BACL
MLELASGNDAALDMIIIRYHKPLFGYLYRLTLDEKVAEDLVQETFVAIYQQGQQGIVPQRFKPWLYKIATNACKDYWKKASFRKESLQAPPREQTSQVANLIERQVERQWMIDALNQLPIMYRTVLYLRFYQDLKYSEIASVVDLPINTIKTQVGRGLKKLECILREEDIRAEVGRR